MLVAHTDGYLGFFEEGKEVEFFHSKQEMPDKTEYCQTHDGERENDPRDALGTVTIMTIEYVSILNMVFRR